MSETTIAAAKRVSHDFVDRGGAKASIKETQATRTSRKEIKSFMIKDFVPYIHPWRHDSSCFLTVNVLTGLSIINFNLQQKSAAAASVIHRSF
jgi:hypothetical protein